MFEFTENHDSIESESLLRTTTLYKRNLNRWDEWKSLPRVKSGSVGEYTHSLATNWEFHTPYLGEVFNTCWETAARPKVVGFLHLLANVDVDLGSFCRAPATEDVVSPHFRVRNGCESIRTHMLTVAVRGADIGALRACPRQTPLSASVTQAMLGHCAPSALLLWPWTLQSSLYLLTWAFPAWEMIF